MEQPKIMINSTGNAGIQWNKEEQSKIDEALRKAALQAEIEKKLREQRWSAPSTNDDKKIKK